MDKRLAKRHKRHVERAKAKVKISEPDVRTPEQIQAAREASRPDTSNTNSPAGAANRGFVNRSASSTGSAPKTAG